MRKDHTNTKISNEEFQFAQLVLRYLDQDTTPKENEWLDTRLQQSDADRATFIEICQQASLIAEVVSPAPTASAMQGQSAPPRDRSPILGFLGDLFQAGADGVSRPLILSLLFTIALPCIVLLVLMVHIGSQPATDVANQPLATDPAVTTSMARVARTHECVWEESVGVMSPGESLTVGRKLRLKRGLAEIHFADGAQVLVQGPAEFQVVAAGEAFLRTGVLSAYVPVAARGFTIRTPQAKVVDLGTEFGLEVRDDSDAEIYVFEGVVEATPLAHGVSGTTRQPLRLEGGAAARLDRRTVTLLEQPADPTRFARRMPDSGVTDRPVIRNPSFECPNVVKHPDYDAERGYVHVRPLVGWKESNFNGQYGPDTFCQLAPFRSPKRNRGFDIDSKASDGRQVAVLTLRSLHPISGPSRRTWIYQSLGKIRQDDLGKTLRVSSDVCARATSQWQGRHDGAKATVAFATNVNEKDPGVVAGTPGVDKEVLKQEGFHTLTATFTPDESTAGQELFVLLMVEHDQPHGKDDNYLFDRIRCRVVGE
jgi:hypothetical protein